MPPVQHLAEVMFWKAVIVTAWATYAETRPDRALLLRFQQEWERRRAKQPLALPDYFTK